MYSIKNHNNSNKSMNRVFLSPFGVFARRSTGYDMEFACVYAIKILGVDKPS